MDNKNLIIVLILIILCMGVIGAYFLTTNNNDSNNVTNLNNTIKNLTKSSNESFARKMNFTNSKNDINSNNDITNINLSTTKKIKNNTKPQNTVEPILISKKQAIAEVKEIVAEVNDGEKVGNTAKLIKGKKRHYWLVPVYNKANGLKTRNYYINAKTGDSVPSYGAV